MYIQWGGYGIYLIMPEPTIVEYVKNNVFWVSEIDSYSVADYAYSQLGKPDAPQELRALCAELLRYGAAAQTFKGLKTDFLADSMMTAPQRELLGDLNAVEFGDHNRLLGDLEATQVTWVGKSLILDTKVTARFVLDTSGLKGEVDTLTLRVTYTDVQGSTKTVLVEEPEAYGEIATYYSFDFSGLLASELRSVLTVAAYMGDTQVSEALEYSIDTYGAGKIGTLGTLCRALLSYSDSAKAFFQG